MRVTLATPGRSSVPQASPLRFEVLKLLVLVAVPVVAFVSGYLIINQGVLIAAAVVGACLALPFLLAGVNRLHVTLLPLGFIAPFAGALLVLEGGGGFSLVFDLLVLLPFAALMLRWVLRPTRVSLFSGGQLLLWAFLVVACFQVLNPDGAGVVVSVQGFRRNILPLLVFFVAFHADLSKPGRLRRMAWTFVLAGVVVALWGLKQHSLGPTDVEQAYASQIGTFWVEGELRIFSTFTSPWGFAAYISAMGILSCALAIGSQTLRERVCALGCCALSTATLLFTYMRGPFLGYAVGLLFLAVALLGARLGKQRIVTAFFVLLAGYALFVMVVGPELAGRISAEGIVARRVASVIAPLNEEGMQIRFATWQSVWPLVTRYPLGLGLGSTGGVSARFEQSLRHGSIHSDNLYLATLLETGWAGGVLLVASVLWIIARGYRRTRPGAPGRDGWVRLGFMSCLIMVTVGNLATPLGFEPGAAQLYWLAAGIVANSSASASEAS